MRTVVAWSDKVVRSIGPGLTCTRSSGHRLHHWPRGFQAQSARAGLSQSTLTRRVGSSDANGRATPSRLELCAHVLVACAKHELHCRGTTRWCAMQVPSTEYARILATRNGAGTFSSVPPGFDQRSTSVCFPGAVEVARGSKRRLDERVFPAGGGRGCGYHVLQRDFLDDMALGVETTERGGFDSGIWP
jgi:hypothetical protein